MLRAVKKINGIMRGGVPLGFMVIVFLEADRQDWMVGRGVGKGVIEA